MLGQQATEEKSNEITAIPLLLEHLDLKGALVTMDAMGTQTEIARAIRDGGGDYCMSLKKNWPAVYAEVEQLFNDPPDDVTFETNETVELTAGRLETRRHTVCHKVDWMTSDRHYPAEPVFPDLAMIGRIETAVERDGKIEHETRYYLCSLALCALTFARIVRAHWGVENRLHWVLDVVFREDLARFRTGDGPQNMAIIRHTTLNLLSRAKPTDQSEEPPETRRLERRLSRNRHPPDCVMFKRFAWAATGRSGLTARASGGICRYDKMNSQFLIAERPSRDTATSRTAAGNRPPATYGYANRRGTTPPVQHPTTPQPRRSCKTCTRRHWPH